MTVIVRAKQSDVLYGIMCNIAFIGSVLLKIILFFDL